mmetsp:Transcript_20591/g.33276  ORF Transcript_20591/g.33276 Transcript_20591/m.33276 type:complete len:86 (-) Transcript_20591:1052-1309(-)
MATRRGESASRTELFSSSSGARRVQGDGVGNLSSFANAEDEGEDDGLLMDHERQQDELLTNISSSLDTINRGALSFKEEIERQNA